MTKEGIAKLRSRQALVRLPDGTEAVPVTLQFCGKVPQMDRAARRQWLRDQFSALRGSLGKGRLQLNLDTVSPSAQTVEALCPVEVIDQVTDLAKSSGLRLDVVSKLQVL